MNKCLPGGVNMLNSDDGVSGDKPAPAGARLLRQDVPKFATRLPAWTMLTQAGVPAIHSPSDWRVLFDTVKCRLREAADAAQHPKWNGQIQAWMGALVRDCEATLDQLQIALEQEHARRWQLEVSAFDAHTHLAQLRAELAGSRASELQARHQALHDSLTALPNRHFFCQRLAETLEAARVKRTALAVFFVDLDGFKAINDTHGHAAGDELLSIMAARLVRAIRADDMVGRIGGDEFACMLMDIHDRQQLSRLACKVYDCVSAPVKLGGLIISVHPSIGVAVFPECGQTSDALLQSADLAMYQAKRELTGYAFFEGEGGTDRGAGL